MSFGTPTLIGTVNVTDGTASKVVSVPGGAINAGDLIFIVAQRSTFTAISATDNASNTYAQDISRTEVIDGSGVANLGAVATGVPTSVTINFGSGFSAKGAQVWAVPGVDAGTRLDTTGSTASGSPHTQPMTASLSLATADERFVLGGFNYDNGGTTATAGTNYTGLSSIDNGLQVTFAAYRIVTASGTHSPLASTGSTGSAWSAVAAAYKGAVPADMTPKPATAGMYDTDLRPEMWF